MKMSLSLFSWADYVIFSLTLLSSLLIGIYNAYKGAAKSISNYLMGGKKMGIFPVAMSLAASGLSATTMLGAPTDVYLTGSMYFWFALALPLGMAVASYVFMPIFYQLQIISVYQYLELRFHPVVRKLASLLYIIKQVVFAAVLAYAPSLALEQVTGINVFISVGLTFGVCTFYTAIGGLKAVVWADTVQMFVMVGSIVTILVKGVMDVGGIETVWQLNIWSLLIGGGFFSIANWGVNQIFVQRFLAMPTQRKAHMSMLISAFISGSFVFLCSFTGLVIYAKYFECDPIKSKIVKKSDQITPYFVMETTGNFPGLPGLFVAGVFSASLSSLSSGLNALALLVLEDFIRPRFTALQDRTATRITIGLSFIIGCIAFGLVFLISEVKTILEASLSVSGASLGSILGVFTLGIFVPWANSIGAGVGLVASFGSMMWLGISTQAAKSRGLLVNNQVKPTSIENCPETLLISLMNSTFVHQQEDVSFLLKISYLWYTLIGMLIVLIVGTLVSFLTGRNDLKQLDPKLVCKFLQAKVGRAIKVDIASNAQCKLMNTSQAEDVLMIEK